jgi:hypothetical protein
MQRNVQDPLWRSLALKSEKVTLPSPSKSSSTTHFLQISSETDCAVFSMRIDLRSSIDIDSSASYRKLYGKFDRSTLSMTEKVSFSFLSVKNCACLRVAATNSIYLIRHYGFYLNNLFSQSSSSRVGQSGSLSDFQLVFPHLSIFLALISI